MSELWEKKYTHLTKARVGLGRNGASLPTKQILDFQRAHAEARNAVLKIWDYKILINSLNAQLEKNVILLSTQATNRELYLKFPNKGKNLSKESLDFLNQRKKIKTDICFIISDGLSSLAIEKNFLGLWNIFKVAFRNSFPDLKYQIIIAPFGRVALSDEIGEILKTQLSIIFIGERPGLNSADSLGIYLTYNPKKGNTDAQRNCISNVRPPDGLSFDLTTLKLVYLIQESLRMKLSGIKIKDEL